MLSLTQAGVASVLGASLLSPRAAGPCVWNPLIRGWGGGWWGATGPGQQWGEPAWSQHPEPGSALGLSGTSLLWARWQVPSCWQGDKEVSSRVRAPLGPSMGPGNNPGGDEVSRALYAPRAGTGMEMGCSSPTSLRAACGAHGHEWCDAGCHPGGVTRVVSSMAPRSPLPTTVPTVGGKRGSVVEPQLVCSNSSNHCTCADEVGTPSVPGG